MTRQPLVSPAQPEAPTLEGVTRKAARGTLVLGARQAAVHGLNIIGAALLARFLSPAEFGFYAILLFLFNFLTAFGDVGLGASLIRQREEPSRTDYRTIFTAQQLMVAAAIALIWLAAPAIAAAYDRPADVWPFRLAALALAFTSLQTIAAIRLERHLEFRRLATVEFVQAVAFNAVAIALAWRGAGVDSIAVALLARSATGALLLNLLQPWPIGLHWDSARLREHLRFGLPYQGVGFISLIKDSITPVFIGWLLGPAEVGYVNWAMMVAAYPALALMGLQRIYFPAFSRLRSDRAELSRLVERVLRAANAAAAPLAMICLVLIVPLTRLVFGAQWLPALQYFYLLWVANLFVPTATPLLGLLNGLGRSRTTLAFAVIWMLGTWIIGAPLILFAGAIGFAIANLAVQFTNLALYRVARAHVDVRVLAALGPPWLAAAAAAVPLALLTRAASPVTVIGLIGFGALGLALYAAALFLVDPGGTRRAIVWCRRELWGTASRS